MQAEFNQSTKIQGDKLMESTQESSKVLEYKAPVHADLEKKQGDALFDAIPKGYDQGEAHHVPKGRATLPEYHQGEAAIRSEDVTEAIATDLIEESKADLKAATDLAVASTEVAKEKAADLYSTAIDKAYQGEQYLVEKAIDGEHYLEEKGKQAFEAAKIIGGSLLSSAAGALYGSVQLAKEGAVIASGQLAHGLEVAEVKAVEGASAAIELAREGAVIASEKVAEGYVLAKESAQIAKEKAIEASHNATDLAADELVYAKEKAIEGATIATEYAKEGYEFAKYEASLATEKATDAATFASTKAADLTHQAASAVTGVAVAAAHIPANASAYISEKKEEFVQAGEYELKSEFGSVLREMANTQLQLKSIEDQKAAEFVRLENERLENIRKQEEHALRQARFLEKEAEMESRMASSLTSSLRQTASQYEDALLEEGRSDELLETYASSPVISGSPAVFATKSEMRPLLQDDVVAEPLSPMTM